MTHNTLSTITAARPVAPTGETPEQIGLRLSVQLLSVATPAAVRWLESALQRDYSYPGTLAGVVEILASSDGRGFDADQVLCHQARVAVRGLDDAQREEVREVIVYEAQNYKTPQELAAYLAQEQEALECGEEGDRYLYPDYIGSISANLSPEQEAHAVERAREAYLDDDDLPMTEGHAWWVALSDAERYQVVRDVMRGDDKARGFYLALPVALVLDTETHAVFVQDARQSIPDAKPWVLLGIYQDGYPTDGVGAAELDTATWAICAGLGWADDRCPPERRPGPLPAPPDDHLGRFAVPVPHLAHRARRGRAGG